ncbi:MAG: glucosaminidase domain-containing protein [Bacteroidota bacterium]
MSSSNSRPAPRRGNERILTIDWSLLWRRARTRVGQYFTALRHKAGRTEYIPPTWLQRFRFSWFRAGLMLLALFVFTQKQVDFTVSVGKKGIAMGSSTGRHMAAQGNPSDPGNGVVTNTLSVMPLGGEPVSAKPWSVDQLDAAKVKSYVRRFEKVAQGEEEKFSIPAPAKMALAILGSSAGQAPAVSRDNNHFGSVTAAKGYYDNAWMNWRAHSEIIDRRFPQLAAESVNYQQWIAALAKTNYSNDRQLANKLMEVIERFGLARL